MFDYEALKQSPNFCIKNFENAQYKGEVIEQVEDNVRKELRHGFGVMTYNSNRLYEGTHSPLTFRPMDE